MENNITGRMKMRGTMLLVIFTLLIAASISANIYFVRKVKLLEDKVWMTKLRLVQFAGITSAIVREKCKLTINDLKDPRFIGAPWEEGKGYLIDYDAQYAFGIKYLFDDKQRLVGWIEVPEIKFRYKNEKGEEILREFKDVVYEDDGLKVDRE